MRGMAQFLIISCVSILAISNVLAQQEGNSVADKIKWQMGPCVSDLGREAQVHIPAGFVFADAKDTRKLMEAMQNPISGQELGFLSPATHEWFLIFEFDDVGYIKDDEKSSLNADEMLKSIKLGNDAANQERKKRGWDPINIVGWELPPRYNSDTHNLEWATQAEIKGENVINWNTRLLGRRGVMSVTLVGDPKNLKDTLPIQQELLSGFSFASGHSYAEFRSGDKVAKYGLGALVVGGAAAVAVKAGLFKYIGKFLVVILAGIAAFFKNVWAKVTNKPKEKAVTPN